MGLKTAKRKGTRNEHRTEEHLKKLGMNVIRAAGSLGKWDLVAYDSTRVRYIQVKSNRKPPKKEWDALVADNVPDAICTKELWIWHDYNSNPEIISIPKKVTP